MKGKETRMWQKEDTTYNDIREKSMMQWLDEMQQHDDIAVRGGVKVTKEYIDYLKRHIKDLEDQNKLKDEYLKNMVKKYK